MGWNSWNKFACNIEEKHLKIATDKVIEMGLDKLGYNYINVDDCWQLEERDLNGHVQPDPKAFPSGMKSLADYVHSKGLLFGIYSSAGTKTCEGRAGGLHHEEIDAKDYASWGVDYLKYDNCYNDNVSALERYTAMRDALAATGRPIFYSICNWGDEETWKWAPSVGNSYRISGDIINDWEGVESNFFAAGNVAWEAGPGNWNDPDMLEVGNGGLTLEEEKTHFALWALLKAPLIIGADLDKISAESLEILKNEHLIAVNQDPLGKQGYCQINCDWFSGLLRTPQIWAGPLANGDQAVVAVNWRALDYSGLSFTPDQVGLAPGKAQRV